jgi:uncharacterized protein YjbI with pentapeptide repeats
MVKAEVTSRMETHGERYRARVAGYRAKFGPGGSLVIAYTVAVYPADERTQVSASFPLDWERTRYLHSELVDEAKKALESNDWRIVGNWNCLAPAQHWFDGDQGNWVAPVVPVTDRLRRAGAVMRGVNLAGQDLTAMILTGANLAGADLRGADLSWADLSGADLTAAVLTGALLLGTDLRGADLTRADLAGTELSEADLRGAKLAGADLRDVNTQGPNTVLDGAKAIGANLSGARLGSLRDMDLTDADLSHTDLRGSWISGSCLRRATLVGADLTNARLSEADLTGAVLPELDAMVNVTWIDGTTWDPAIRSAVEGRSTERVVQSSFRQPQPQPQGRFKFFRRRVVSRPVASWREFVLNPPPPR